MKGSKLFKNVKLKGQKELVSILVEDGIFKKISADIGRRRKQKKEQSAASRPLPKKKPAQHRRWGRLASRTRKNQIYQKRGKKI